MLSVPGVGRKEYQEKVGRGQAVPEVPCPSPACMGRLQRAHGYYKRYVACVLFEVRRLICLVCGVTNAILPADICAYRDLTLTALEAAADAGPGPSARAKAADEKREKEPMQNAKRRARRWALEGGSFWVSRLVALLPAAPLPWIERVRAVVGAAPGALVRMRSWLWSQKTVFLGGPSGLYRLGRPGGRPGAAPNRGW
jgi:hypothetical protein